MEHVGTDEGTVEIDDYRMQFSFLTASTDTVRSIYRTYRGT